MNSWDTLRNVVGEEENYTSDEDQERIDLRMWSTVWSTPRRWQEGATEWQNWSNWPSGHQTRHENDETEDDRTSPVGQLGWRQEEAEEQVEK